MPDGAQAWKMIKTPGSQNGRIAQACDRCRSKKIKCDGKRPHCSQCAAVGFECKITDKLTRRAFPRGYTESLEDRVRQLESETQKLTNLLDLKDEQLEMMSKVDAANNSTNYHHVNSTDTNSQRPTTSVSSASSVPTLEPASSSSSSGSDDDEDLMAMPQVEKLVNNETYTGASAGSILSTALQRKFEKRAPAALEPIQQIFNNGTSNQEVKASYQYHSVPSLNNHTNIPYNTPPASVASVTSPTSDNGKNSPPPGVLSGSGSATGPNTGAALSYAFSSLNNGSRLTCDQLVTTFFQEWHSMFSILDQYSFLEEYHSFANDVGSDPTFAVTLVLIQCLASLVSRTSNPYETKSLEKEWKRLFTPALQQKPTLRTCQALLLAELYSLYVHNEDDIWLYRSLTITMAQRLGLYKCQSKLKDENNEPLTPYRQEMRRRTFWNVYVLDTFSAAVLGTTRLVNDRDVSCKMPSNIDDDALITTTEQDSSTCAYSVVTFTKILARILDTIYSTSTQLSAKTVIRFEDQLETWRRDLIPHLKFEFANGVPTATMAPVHQKSPLLLMMYHYARVLIHTPSMVAGDKGGSGGSISATQSAKTFLQVFNYLQKRKVQSTLCMNPSRLVIRLSSIVLYSAVDYSRGGALLQEARTLMSGAQEFVYTDMQTEKPGCVSCQCYQWFEEACDVVLGSASLTSCNSAEARRPSTGKKRTSRKSSTSSKKQQPQPQAQAQAQAGQPQQQQPKPGSKKSNKQSIKKEKSDSVKVKLESPPTTSEDEEFQVMNLLQDNDSFYSTPASSAVSSKAHSTSSQLQNQEPLNLESLLFDDHTIQQSVAPPPPPPPPAAHHQQPSTKDDYLDFWNPIDYMNLCDRSEGFFLSNST